MIRPLLGMCAVQGQSVEGLCLTNYLSKDAREARVGSSYAHERDSPELPECLSVMYAVECRENSWRVQQGTERVHSVGKDRNREPTSSRASKAFIRWCDAKKWFAVALT